MIRPVYKVRTYGKGDHLIAAGSLEEACAIYREHRDELLGTTETVGSGIKAVESSDPVFFVDAGGAIQRAGEDPNV